jgi:hypothetical protein
VQPNAKRNFYILAGVMIVLGLGMIAGGSLAWMDEHSGTAGTAHVTGCTSHDFGPRTGGSINCDATWVYKGRVVHGYIENGRANQVGKDVSVRVHGTSHVTEQSYWVPIGLWVMGLFVVVTFVLVTRQVARRAAAPVTPAAPPTGSAAA